MTRFHCESCGSRLIAQERHLRRLVRCPDCGVATHPLARDILCARVAAERTAREDEAREREAARALAAARPVATATATATATPRRPGPPSPGSGECANCGVVLGKLQMAHRWRDHVVCAGCHEALAAEAAGNDAAPRRARRALLSPSASYSLLSGPRLHSLAGPAPSGAEPLPEGADARAGAFDRRHGFGGAVLGLSLTAAALFLAVSLMSYAGLLLNALLLGLLVLFGLYCMRRGLMAFRRWLDALHALRAEQGVTGVITSLRRWASSQGPGRVACAVLGVLLFSSLYTVYLATSAVATRGGLLRAGVK